MAFDWYPFDPTEYRRKTYHLCAAADGIYRRLIDEYMLTRAPLPDNDAALAGIARVGIPEWNEHREAVRAFFKSKDGKLTQKRCDQELDAQRMHKALRVKIAKEAATVRWAKEKSEQSIASLMHASRNASAMLPDATLQDKDKKGPDPPEIVSREKVESEKKDVATPYLVATFKQKGWVNSRGG